MSLAGPPPAGRVELVAGDGLNEPFGVDFDAAGNTYVVEMGGNRVTVLDGRGGRRVLASDFKGPHHLLIGPDGALYVADTWNYRVRRFDLQTGGSTVVAGTGQKAFGGDGGPAVDAQFGGIFSIAFHKGDLYICDLDNRRVRAVDRKTGLVTTVAGNGEKGVPRDGEDARTQPLVDPRAIAFDDKGNLYIAERGGHALRVVDAAGKIRTVAGTGVAGSGGRRRARARRAAQRAQAHLRRAERRRPDHRHREPRHPPLRAARRHDPPRRRHGRGRRRRDRRCRDRSARSTARTARSSIRRRARSTSRTARTTA